MTTCLTVEKVVHTYRMWMFTPTSKNTFTSVQWFSSDVALGPRSSVEPTQYLICLPYKSKQNVLKNQSEFININMNCLCPAIFKIINIRRLIGKWNILYTLKNYSIVCANLWMWLNFLHDLLFAFSTDFFLLSATLSEHAYDSPFENPWYTYSMHS